MLSDDWLPDEGFRPVPYIPKMEGAMEGMFRVCKEGVFKYVLWGILINVLLAYSTRMFKGILGGCVKRCVRRCVRRRRYISSVLPAYRTRMEGALGGV